MLEQNNDFSRRQFITSAGVAAVGSSVVSNSVSAASKNTMKKLLLVGIAAFLMLPIIANAGAEDYRFPREPGTTKDGYPLPLTGKPITKTPVITESGDANLPMTRTV